MKKPFYNGVPKTRAELIKELITQQELHENTIDLYPDKDLDLVKDPERNALGKITKIRKGHIVDNELKSRFNEAVFNNLTSSTLYYGVVLPVLEDQMCNTHEKALAESLINSFVKEKGARNIVESFRDKSIYLEEFRDLINRYHKVILEQVNDKKESSNSGYTEDDLNDIEDDTIKSFIIDTKKNIPNDISTMISNRVEDSVNDFIDKNKKNKFEIKKVYDKAKEKIAQLEPTIPDDTNGMYNDTDSSELDADYQQQQDPAPGQEDPNNGVVDPTQQPTKDQIQQEALRYIRGRERELLESPDTVFGTMVKIMLESVHKYPVLKESYSNESNNGIDFKKVINDTKVIYTFMECLNTLNIIDMNEQSVKDYLLDIKNSISETNDDFGLPSDTSGGSSTTNIKTPTSSSSTGSPTTNVKTGGGSTATDSSTSVKLPQSSSSSSSGSSASTL